MVTAYVLLITGCGNSNSTEDFAGADGQVVQNAKQTDIEEKVASEDIDTNISSPLDGVMMEITEYSDTSVTIRITNDTDKNILCGSDFCLEMQDEETSEWKKLDTVIDEAAFTLEAYTIQKDVPYEVVIDFEWLYGKLKPGKYRIVKTIMDFRRTADYTDYIFTAEFSI